VTNVTIKGIDDVNRILAEIAPREAKNLLRSTTLDLAKQLAVDAKTYTPDDPATQEWVGDSFSQKRERGTRNLVQASVIVKKAKGSRSFIWKFLEYGTGPERVEHAMFLKAFQKMKPEIVPTYLQAFGKALEKRLKRLRK
jgi:HK97 gp10 family phage protein